MTVFKIFNFLDQLGTDKVLHLIACYTITLLVVLVGIQFMVPGNAMVAGALSALAVGFGKECYDKIKGNIFDSIDLCFDIIGIAMAMFAMLVIL